MIRTEINKIDNRQTTENQWEKKLVLWWGGRWNQEIWQTFRKTSQERRCNLSTSGKRGNTATELVYINRIREYHEQLYTDISENLHEMDQFLEKHKLSQLIQHEIISLVL